MENNDGSALAESPSTSTSAASSAAATDAATSPKQPDSAASANRRAKGMSIGNAASLFGGGDEDALFGGVSSKPAAAGASSPFEAIGEEAEEPSQAQQAQHLNAGASSSNSRPRIAKSPSDDAAALFGDSSANAIGNAGQAQQLEWLGGAASSSAQASSSDNEASALFAGLGAQQQQQQDPALYAGSSYGDNGQQYAAYDYQQQQGQQQANGSYGYQQDAYAQQVLQDQYTQQQPSQYAYYDQPAVDNFSQGMYSDPTQQQQYQQSLYAQAQHNNAYMPQQQQSAYDASQQYGQQSGSYAPAAGQDQYANYYAQQQLQPSTSRFPQQGYDQQNQYYDYSGQQHGQYSQQQPAAGPASAYQQPQDYLQAQQQTYAPQSAPASTAQTNHLARSQSSQSNAGQRSHYAPSYTSAYDPYAPSSNDPYASQAPQSNAMPKQGTSSSSGHQAKQPSLSSSKTAPDLAAASKDPTLNRSKSSFFAELPPMPVKSRPASSMAMRGAGGQSVPPVPAFGGQGSPQLQQSVPPPPKSKSPMPPPARTKPIQPGPPSRMPSTMAAGPSSRPGSRTAQRQDSTPFSASSSARSSLEYHPGGPQQAYGSEYGITTGSSGRPSYESAAGNNANYGQYTAQQQPNGQHRSSGLTSPSMSSRPSLDPSHSQYPVYSQQPNAQQPARSESPYGNYPAPARQPTSTLSPRQQHSLLPLQPPVNITAQHRPPPPHRQLSKSDNASVDDLVNSFQASTIADRAAKVPLPASEPDSEPRVMSPSQHSASDDHASSFSPRSQKLGLMSPPRSSLPPSLEVTLPSPEVERKPVIQPDYEQAAPHSPDMSSDMRMAEEELTKAEREIKLEEQEDEEMDRKPSPDDLARAMAEAAPSSSSDPYSDPYGDPYAPQQPYTPVSEVMEPYEERKPSQEQLQDAWNSSQASEHSQEQKANDEPSYASRQASDWDYGYEEPAQQQQPFQSDYSNQVYPSQQPSSEDRYTGQMQTDAYSQAAYAPSQPAYDAYTTTSTSYGAAEPSAPAYVNGHASEDPSRLRNRPAIPIASFGFNGKLVTFFPSSASTSAPSYGMPYEGSSTSGSDTQIKIRKLAEFLPNEVSTLESFPGPLFMNSAATGASGKAKKKKEILAWLESRIDESQKERNYLGSQAEDLARGKADEKTILLQLLKLLLEHDGKLLGTAQLDQLVRQVLVPHLDPSSSSTGQFAVASDLASKDATTHSQIPAASQAQPADLEALQAYLLRGEKREAVQYALNNRLYSHALVIASGTDKELLATVVKEFLEAELGGAAAAGKESLKVVYSLLAGAGSEAINQFIPPRRLASQATPQSQSLGVTNPYAPGPSRTPTPENPALDYPADVGASTLRRWTETAAMVVANRCSGDAQTLTSLGDVLSANGWYRAAHSCYLLSPVTSGLGGPGTPKTRWSLLGGQQPLQNPASCSDLESVLLTEIVEFALSLVPVPKGQEAYIGLPHLQAYRLLHARELADLGFHSKAQKYCDCIGATLKLATRASPFYHPSLLGQVKELSDRLSNVSFQDKTGSWISRKVPKPTIDNVWSTLENRFAKFVAGEAEEDPAEVEKRRLAREAAKGVAGPFAHYSAITPSGPESLSRNASYADLTSGMRATPPPQPTSVPNTVSNATVTKATHHRRSSSYAYGPYGADPYGGYVPQMPETAEEPDSGSQGQSSEPQSRQSQDTGYGEPQYGYVTPQNDSGWWSSSNNGQDMSPYGSNSSYGHAPTFSPVTEGYGHTDSQGLMSPMGFQQSPHQFQPQPSKLQHQVSTPATIEEDDDELGLGNNSNKRRQESQTPVPEASTSAAGARQEATKKEPAKKDEAPALNKSASSSWLGRIWRRDGGASPTAGPIKAKLGEETSFVYDPVEKRWVNKKAGADTPPPAATPPPPSRAQTASPSGFPRQFGDANAGTPPPPAVRAHTASPGHASSLPPPPMSASVGSTPPPRPASATPSGNAELPPPPAKKPGGAAAKKNVRSRYVDVLAQDQK